MLTLTLLKLQSPRLIAQREFVRALVAIGEKLKGLATKDLKGNKSIYLTFIPPVYLPQL